jgi:quinol monooxygenase YgiN
MIHPSKVVSIHPYFRVAEGRMEEARAILRRFVEITQPDPGCLYYDFSISGNVIFCREAYDGAEGLLRHITQVGTTLDQFLKLVEVIRLELHASAAEIEKLKGPLAAMNPEWFVFETGVTR